MLGLLGAIALAAPVLAQGQARLSRLRDDAAMLDQLHSLIVLRDGEEILANAFRGPGLDRVANVKSVSKTLLSLLVGIGTDRDVLSVDDAVLPLLDQADTGDARDDLTVGDLLSLRGALASTSGPNYGAWVSSDNWVRFALEQPIRSQPGDQFIYSTGSTHLLGVALAQAAGDDLLGLARGWLGTPLGIDFAPWVADPQGNYLGGNDMALSPRHLARIGQMCLDGGRWNGRQIISEAWLTEAWTPRARSPWSGDRYGYGWFLTTLGGQRAVYGRGYGGQVLAIVPEARLVIAITSDPNRPARSAGYFGELRTLMDEIATV
ncbi:MAG: serine hydrolase [Pseudomonadota bacterium]